jgi:hypothetical protein
VRSRSVTGDELDERLASPTPSVPLDSFTSSGALGDRRHARASREDEGPDTHRRHRRQRCAAAGVVGALLFGPVEGPAGRQVVGSLLGGVHGGILARQSNVDEEGEFLFELARACAGATGPRELAAALAATRRAAIRARLPARLWSAYELFTAEND